MENRINNTFGVVDNDFNYIETSKTLRGAKMYATRNGYKAVCTRLNGSLHVKLTQFKVKDSWVSFKEGKAKDNKVFYDEFNQWVEGDDVIFSMSRLAYRTQCTLYTKEFTRNELKLYFAKEYLNN